MLNRFVNRVPASRIAVRWLATGLCAVTFSGQALVAQDGGAKAVAGDKAAAEGEIVLAGGKVSFKTPADWKAVPPKSNIVQYEFVAPANEEKADSQARVTIMGAGGSIEDNIVRWYGQFEQPDGSATKDKSKVEKFEAAEQTIHWVEIPGTFKDSGGGPFAPQRAAVKRENYRMLGAIIETKGMGQYFIKITGPAPVVEKLGENLRKSLEGLQVKK